MYYDNSALSKLSSFAKMSSNGSKGMSGTVLTVAKGLHHGCIMLSGYSVFGGPQFVLMKAAQWRMKPKISDFSGLKIPKSEAV